MRLICAAAVALVAGLWLAYADDNKPEDAKARAAKLDALKKKFDEEFADLAKRLQRAETPAEKRGAESEMRELVALTAEKATKIAEGDPKDETALAALEFVLKAAEKTGTGGKEVQTALALLAEHHAASPKIKDLLVPALRIGAAGDNLLATVAEKGADKETRAIAGFLRGFKIAQTLDDEEDEKRLNEKIALATDLMEKAAKDAPDAKLGRMTVGEIAKKELETLKSVTLVAVGKPAPDVESYTLDGKKVKLSDYKGKVVLLDLWATWCPPCRAMIPHEREMVAKMEKDKKPFVLISVSADDKKEDLEKFLETDPMPWVHWWDGGAENPVVKKFRVKAFPTLYLIDHAGVIRQKWVGKPDNDRLDKSVEDAVKEAIKAKG